MRKEMYKGYDEEQLSKITNEEFMKLVTSRERRTLNNLKRNPELKKLMNKIKKVIKEGKKDKMIKTHLREAVIVPEWMGLTFGVYNGKEFRKVVITMKHVGKRLGDFAHTTGPVKHSGPGVGATRGSKFVPLK
ncbi:MAG: ribosomal protein S19 family protein [Candidatus ainarchaeum sp.]|nr:ribosomal protein S19 family protein [Candidatus ainarchaeum sp.]